jgi:ATP-dependent DNA helicase RecG
MTEECFKFGIPSPLFFFKSSGFWVEFRMDIYNEKYLNELDLNERQVKAILYVKKKGKITNSVYQTLNEVSRETATRDLKELIDKHLIKSSGQKGAGAFYTLE